MLNVTTMRKYGVLFILLLLASTFLIAMPAFAETTVSVNKPTLQAGSTVMNSRTAKTPFIRLDKNLMMIDNEHYDSFTLTATVKNATASDIIWKINCKKPYKNAASFSSKKNQLKKKGGKTVTIYGKKWSGNDAITVTATVGGKTAKCKLKVISCGMADSDVNNIPGGNTHKTCNDVYHGNPIQWEGKTFYLTEPASKRKGNVLKTKSYGADYVAAYINNADRMVKESVKVIGKKSNGKKKYKLGDAYYNRFKSEYAAKTYTCSRQANLKVKWDNKAGKMKISPRSGSNNFKTYKKTKKKGALSATNYLFFFSNKNQWEYLLKKEKGAWKCIAAKRASSAHSNHAFSTDWAIKVVGWNENGMGLVGSHYPEENGHSSVRGAGNFMHLQNNSHIGTPGTEGCTMLGKETDKIYYQTLIEAGLGTRVIIY